MAGLSGSTVFGIRQDVLRSVQVLVPDETTLIAFENFAAPLLEQIRLNDQQNQELAALRDWLLPMLMNGQVTVQS